MVKISVIFLLFSTTAWSQSRYLDTVFQNVLVTPEVVYGHNATIVVPFLPPIKEPLLMDVYQPAGDTATNRPVVLFFHTGNFLPFISPIDGAAGFNGKCGGTRTDSTAIEICTRLAKMGYVACSVDYRLGWNPLSSSDVLRRYQLLNAVYRGIQDLRTSIRFLRRATAEENNPWGIDPDKIVVWGDATGGTIVMNAIFLDDYEKIPSASQGKFLFDDDGNPATPEVPMVIPEINGDIWGTSIGLDPQSGDTLCYPNHPGYPSEFTLGVNMAGACLDSAWIDPGQCPLISFHVPFDRDAPYAEGIYTIPSHLQVVVQQGSYVVQNRMEDLGNNQPYSGAPITDLQNEQLAAFSQTPILGGNDWTDPTPGLYPFNMPIIQQTPVILPASIAPWEWSGPVPNNPTCNLNKAAAIPYIDTILRFTAPRACFTLGLQDCIDQIVAQEEPLAKHIQVTAAPNPSASDVLISTGTEHSIQAMEVYDMHGRMVRSILDIDNNTYTLQRNSLPNGIFVAKLYFKEGVQTLRFVLE